jgi:ribosomal protein L37AE/L43A
MATEEIRREYWCDSCGEKFTESNDPKVELCSKCYAAFKAAGYADD